MIFEIEVLNKKVTNGYEIAGEILAGREIIDELWKIRTFTYSLESGRYVANKLADRFHPQGKPVLVQEYYYESKSVVGTTFSDKPGIFVNRYNFHRFPLSQYIRNGAHEVAHHIGFGHGSNWTQDNWKGRMMCKLKGDVEDKNLSVPYVLEEIVIKLAKKRGLL